MKIFRQFVVLLISFSFVLSGCVTTSGNGSSSNNTMGPQLSSLINKIIPGNRGPQQVDPNRPKLDIIIPLFDPGLPEDPTKFDDEGVWPELRRAESVRYAYKLKSALENTRAFGSVRVTPDSTATGDLYVLGKIEGSDGEDVEIDITVVDISGRHWFNKSFDHSVDSSFRKNIRNKGKDPYDPVFEHAANYLVAELAIYDYSTFNDLHRMSDLRFGASFSEEAFSEHLTIDNGRYLLASFPSNSDPMLIRTKAIRVRDQLYVDGLQDTYRSFSELMNESYLVWQEQAQIELEAKREAQMEAAGEATVGVLAIGVAILAIATGANSNSPGAGAAAMTGGMLAGAAGAHMLQESFQTSKESKVHKDALHELGESIDSDLAPHVVAFEEQSIELSGTAKEQFTQWRSFLKKIYAQESTPELQL